MGVRILLATLFISSTAESAFEHVVRGGRATGMGGAVVAVEEDIWASFANPSCLPTSRETRIAVEFSPVLFGMNGLKRGALSATRSLPMGTFALAVSGFGFELYRELTVGIAWARMLTEHVALGIGVNLYSLGIRHYGSDVTVGLDVGMLLQLTPLISYGLSFRNVNRPSVGTDKEPLPQTMGMGVSVRPFRDALVALSAEKDSHYPFELCIGVEYCFEGRVTVRCGAVNEPSAISAGFGVRTSLLDVDYAYNVHPDLGGTHCFSLSFPLPWP